MPFFCLNSSTATPVEPVQPHYMRIAEPRGLLARKFPDGWEPAKQSLLTAVLAENRRWRAFHARDVLKYVELVRTAEGRLDCNESTRKAVGLNYAQMIELADKTNFRHALWQIGETIAQMFEATIHRSPRLAKLPAVDSTGWDELIRRWQRK